MIDTTKDEQVNIYRAGFRKAMGEITVSRTKLPCDGSVYNVKTRNLNTTFDSIDDVNAFLMETIYNYWV
jgi:hypothetical protein